MLIDLLASPEQASAGEGYAVMALVGAVWLIGYAVACWRWPFRNCRKCEGTARVHSPSGKTFRRCKRCKATGRRLRKGRWVFNYFWAKKNGAR